MLANTVQEPVRPGGGSEHGLSSGMVMWMVDVILNVEGLKQGSVGPSSCSMKKLCGGGRNRAGVRGSMVVEPDGCSLDKS